MSNQESKKEFDKRMNFAAIVSNNKLDVFAANRYYNSLTKEEKAQKNIDIYNQYHSFLFGA